MGTEKELEAVCSTVLQYLNIHDPPVPSDCIIGFGSCCSAVPHRAADLFHEGLAPRIVFCGGRGRLSGTIQGSEAAWLKEIALRDGVPSECILLEERSSNTLENVLNVRMTFLDHGSLPRRAILVAQNVLQRRVWTTWIRHMPEVRAVNCPPTRTFLDHPQSKEKTREKIILCIGEIDRLQEYGHKGDIVKQEIPDEVVRAAQILRQQLTV